MSQSPAESTIAEAIATRPIPRETSPSAMTSTVDVGRGLPIALDLEDESDE
ncbi:hypothetical protein SAMN05216184_1193 [Georgenia satyanarayanai]|uniref:Uncharacterized protein n=1 Tax=Georgenia satyanarayanai TaxID=860221 RepID=A0A2Y9ARZ9_9MICO|nr:hypothetical protein [Georgenia satyanarayanai]PYF96343.1 hypothetical protein A8987_1193 [Georgenia satyanarayanai]SSA46865.1 hypothetical protein SAMN05216184_1193 [Georgenia satyanarayanai]